MLFSLRITGFIPDAPARARSTCPTLSGRRPPSSVSCAAGAGLQRLSPSPPADKATSPDDEEGNDKWPNDRRKDRIVQVQLTVPGGNIRAGRFIRYEPLRYRARARINASYCQVVAGPDRRTHPSARGGEGNRLMADCHRSGRPRTPVSGLAHTGERQTPVQGSVRTGFAARRQPPQPLSPAELDPVAKGHN
jgi:hypothetical protein